VPRRSKGDKLSKRERIILSLLVKNARLKYTEIAKKVGMSIAGVLKRVKWLESEGYIIRYTAILNHEKLGKSLLVFIFVKTEAGATPDVAKKISSLDPSSILEVHEITGEYDLLIKAYVEDRRALQSLVWKILRIPSVVTTHTIVSLSTFYESPSVIIEQV